MAAFDPTAFDRRWRWQRRIIITVAVVAFVGALAAVTTGVVYFSGHLTWTP